MCSELLYDDDDDVNKLICENEIKMNMEIMKFPMP